MADYNDLSGKTFNSWTVIKRINPEKRQVYYLCRCKCGTEKEIHGVSLTRETSKSCGCTRGKDFSKHVGEKHGRLTVLNIGNTIKGHRMCECECECGNTRDDLRLYSVLNGRATSCGCVNANFQGVGEVGLNWWNARVVNGAIKRNLQLDITMEYVWNLFLKQDRKCALTGEFLTLGHKTKITNASLDRKDNKKGYVKGNVQWVTKQINMFKNKYNDDEFIDICTKVVTYHSDK